MENANHANNFDSVRLAAALAVLVSHQYALHAQPEPLVFHYQTLGGYAVMVFFAISGYLITSSWSHDPNIWCFSARRLLRIWPGLICTVLLCGLVLGPLVTDVSVGSYLSDPTTHRFFGTLLFHVSPFLPGVFPHSPLAYIPNGVLWTIPIELRCYGYLAILGLIGVLRYRWIMLALLLGLSFWYYGVHDAEAVFERTHQHLFEVEYATFFFSGSCLYLFRDFWQGRKRKLIGLAVAAALSCIAFGAGHQLIAAFLLTPYLVIVFGSSSLPVFHRFGRFGDMSYGVYIYAFPVQQTVIWLTPSLNIYQHFALAIPLTLACAWLSWHLVEKKALGFKPRRRSRAQVLGAE
jgi:peptidoglycan/LPS O-acetylase OafA/YrhL